MTGWKESRRCKSTPSATGFIPIRDAGQAERTDRGHEPTAGDESDLAVRQPLGGDVAAARNPGPVRRDRHHAAVVLRNAPEAAPKRGLPDKEYQELAGIRADLENAGIGSDEGIDLTQFCAERLRQTQEEMQALRKQNGVASGPGEIEAENAATAGVDAKKSAAGGSRHTNAR